MRKLSEEIARSHQTVDTDPIQYDDHPNVKVDMFGNDSGDWSVQVHCLSDPSLSTRMERFPDDASAGHFARQSVDRIVRATMNEVRNIIRALILEVSEFSCNKHSLGFITDSGEFIDLESLDQNHEEFLYKNGLLDLAIDRDCPPGWIKVSNANEFWLAGNSWESISPRQIDGLIDVWVSCKKFSNWIRRGIEEFYVVFATYDGDMEELTVPEFIEAYGSRQQMEKLFSHLL